MWLQNLDLPMQCERSTISRQLKIGKDTPSLIDVKGLGRPKEFFGREEDFQQWSKKTAAFFAGVVKESEMMLQWAAEKMTEITTELIDREFSADCDEPGARTVQNLECVCSRCIQHSWLSRVMRRMTLPPNCRQIAEESVGGMAEAAETI